VKIIAPLIAIAVAATNLLGIWRTEAQTAAFAKQREWAESNERHRRERKELEERLEKQRRELDDFWRRHR
jgi:DNA-binding IclR family transcriptional regulator